MWWWGLVVLVGWSGWLGDSRHQGKGWKSPLYHSVPRKPYHTELYPAILNWLCQRGGSFRAPPRMPYDTAISHSKEREGRDHLGSVPGTLPPTVLKPLKDRKVTSNKYHLWLRQSQLVCSFESQSWVKVKVVKWCRKKWNEHNLMYIYHKQYEIKQKIQWNSSNGQLHLFPIDSLCKAMQTQTLKRLVKITSFRK